MEELLAKAVTIDGRKECLTSETSVWTRSKVSDKHPVSVAMQTQAGCIDQEWSELVELVLMRRV